MATRPIRYDAGARNVLGEELVPCSLDPVTGFFRNGCCETGPHDVGMHTVCAVMTADFLAFSKSMGNDLSTPRFVRPSSILPNGLAAETGPLRKL